MTISYLPFPQVDDFNRRRCRRLLASASPAAAAADAADAARSRRHRPGRRRGPRGPRGHSLHLLLLLRCTARRAADAQARGRLLSLLCACFCRLSVSIFLWSFSILKPPWSFAINFASILAGGNRGDEVIQNTPNHFLIRRAPFLGESGLIFPRSPKIPRFSIKKIVQVIYIGPRIVKLFL